MPVTVKLAAQKAVMFMFTCTKLGWRHICSGTPCLAMPKVKGLRAATVSHEIRASQSWAPAPEYA